MSANAKRVSNQAEAGVARRNDAESSVRPMLTGQKPKYARLTKGPIEDTRILNVSLSEKQLDP